MITELNPLPCEQCKSTRVIVWAPTPDDFWVSCTNDSCEAGPVAHSYEEAITAWNKQQKIETALQELVDDAQELGFYDAVVKKDVE